MLFLAPCMHYCDVPNILKTQKLSRQFCPCRVHPPFPLFYTPALGENDREGQRRDAEYAWATLPWALGTCLSFAPEISWESCQAWRAAGKGLL